jgi:topoisomerase-4 subunit A
VGGFIGTRVKPSNKNDSALECTEFDRLLVLRTDGTCVVMAVEEKSYVGQAKYVFLYNKDQVFSVLYHDKKAGTWYAKRFQIESYILGKEYHVAPEGCQIDALYTEPTAVELELPVNRRRSFNSIKVDFERLPLRSREARGFKLTSLQVLGFKTIDRSEVPPDDPPEAEAAPPAPPASGDGAGGGNGPGERPKGEPLHQPNLPFFL